MINYMLFMSGILTFLVVVMFADAFTKIDNLQKNVEVIKTVLVVKEIISQEAANKLIK